MKILYLYQYVKSYCFDHYLHGDVAVAMNKVPGVEVKGYGLNLEEGYPGFAIPYNANLTLSDIKKEFNFDIILICTKDRMFRNYIPPYFNRGEIREGCWLPSDFKSCTVPKIVLEEDYHYEFDDNWYVENNIDLILQRHYGSFLKGQERKQMKHLWLPFSVDTSVFKPNDTIQRIEKICSAASLSETFYVYRHKACNILEPLGLLVNMGNKAKENNIYPTVLQSYISHLCCSGLLRVTTAKLFEIAASGSVIFTNESDLYGIQQLFPKDTYCTYKEDFSNVVEQATMIIQDRDYRSETTEKALKCILERHTHEIRTNEFLDIVKKEFGI